MAQHEDAGVARAGLFMYPITSCRKQVYRLMELAQFYTPAVLETVLVPLLTQTDAVSLRVLDWLVTNYSKKKNVVYAIANPNTPGECVMFNVYISYKTWLRYYRRRNFDPFRRRQRVEFVSDGITYETTTGQLNFVMWAVQYGVLDYARRNISALERDMNANVMCNRKRVRCDSARADDRPVTKKTHRRKEISAEAPCRKCCVYTADVTICFDDNA